ncbi:MAG: rhomboid family intramembrane serine protease [Frankiales bacterium]|nr:rhomboid family intramembrane serine protease [Frankiales bacterium]
MSTPEPTGPADTPVPVCYRHPGRETYIRCTRCERPICPDCMISASVGFQCPECVAEGRAEVRPVVTRLGARAVARPYVTFTLIALNVAVYALTLAAPTDPSTGLDTATADYSLWPFGVALYDQYYRLLTAMFLHGSLTHIAFNMLALWIIGPQLELLLGHVRYGVLYLVAGLGGSVASFWFSPPNIVGVGASGAIFGLMGAAVVVARKLDLDLRPFLWIIVLNVVIGFVLPSIDWRAHLGGLVTGAVLGGLFAYAPARIRVPVQVAGVALVLALLVVATLQRDAAITAQFAGILGGVTGP